MTTCLLKIEGTHYDVVKISPNAKIQTQDGKIPGGNGEVNINDTGPDAYQDQFTFFGIVLAGPSPTISPAISGFYRSLQLGTFDLFGSGPPDDISNCVSISWDPYGRVFGSKSLEPLPNIKVTILDKNKQQVSQPQTRNPVTTIIDGIFNFLVNEGIYYLKVAVSNGYKFIQNPSINPNYVNIYKNLYKPDSPIPELIDTEEERQSGRPNPEHRDIPLDPGDNKPYEVCPVSLLYGIVRLGSYSRVTGKVSHPLTKVSLKQDKNELLTKQADIYGSYELTIENKKIDPSRPMTISFSKTDLTGTNRIFPDCDFSLTVNPILPYIEGYTYDTQGNVIPKAKILVSLDKTNKKFYETTADNNGYFKINTPQLPIFSYHMTFTNPVNNSITVTTTADFVKNNKTYLTNNKINLQTATKDGKSIVADTVNSPTADFQFKGNDLNKRTNQPLPSAKPRSKFAIVIVVLLALFLTLVVVDLFFFLKKKNFLIFSPPLDR